MFKIIAKEVRTTCSREGYITVPLINLKNIYTVTQVKINITVNNRSEKF